jgi:putative restriction endonuclease
MNDLYIRTFAFDWLRTQVDIYGDLLPRKILHDGFNVSGEKYGLVGPTGIWKPKSMKLPISITSVLGGKYADTPDEKGEIFHYKYRGTNPNHLDNVGLRELYRQKIPFICFLKIEENKYYPVWPAFVLNDNPADLTFSIVFDKLLYLKNNTILDLAAESEENFTRREYITITTLQRVHQKDFREKVLKAYRNQCALCRLKHPELLDAAHIIGDKEDNGEPIIQNGLSLCKIHHSAFDQYLIGISPDYQVKVRRDILEEIDGPMLKYGLQSMNNATLILPKHLEEWPDRVRLEERFSSFLKAE